MTFVDTNILLRWLLKDHAALSAKAEKLINEAAPGSLLITDIIAAEIVYVLRATDRDRQQTAEALLLIARTPPLKYENDEILFDALRHYAKYNLDFADCYLLARASRSRAALHTFDKALANTLARQRSAN